MGKSGSFWTSRFFYKLISRKIRVAEKILRFPHTEIAAIYSHAQKFRQINGLSTILD